MNIIKNAVLSLSKYIELVPAKSTSEESLRSLVNSLHPIHPGVEMVRLGPRGDGGYVVPDDLEEVGTCISPGVGPISEFEADCADLGMNVILADRTVDKPSTSHENFEFIRSNVGSFVGENLTTIDDIVEKNIVKVDGDILLQIDIEGSEYEVIHNMSVDLLKRSRIIVVEFHRMHHMFYEQFFSFASRAFEKLLSTHECVHIHPNNTGGLLKKDEFSIPRLMEFTFLRKERIQEKQIRHNFPHPLDEDNKENNHIELPECWYGGSHL